MDSIFFSPIFENFLLMIGTISVLSFLLTDEEKRKRIFLILSLISWGGRIAFAIYWFVKGTYDLYYVADEFIPLSFVFLYKVTIISLIYGIAGVIFGRNKKKYSILIGVSMVVFVIFWIVVCAMNVITNLWI